MDGWMDRQMSSRKVFIFTSYRMPREWFLICLLIYVPEWKMFNFHFFVIMLCSWHSTATLVLLHLSSFLSTVISEVVD